MNNIKFIIRIAIFLIFIKYRLYVKKFKNILIVTYNEEY